MIRRFEFTTGRGFRRPCLPVVLRYAGRSTPPHQMVLDTGSDRCMFDEQLARDYLAFNPATDGIIDSATGISGSDPVAVFPVEIFIPDLSRSFQVHAQFKRLPFPGVLGFEGVLDQYTVTFHRGQYFEIS